MDIEGGPRPQSKPIVNVPLVVSDLSTVHTDLSVDITVDVCVDKVLVREGLLEGASSHVPFSTQSVDEHIFYCLTSEGGRVVGISSGCTKGNCCCVNLIGDIHCNLKPCRVGSFLFGGDCTLPSDMVQSIWNGLYDDFKNVDDDFDSIYECENTCLSRIRLLEMKCQPC